MDKQLIIMRGLPGSGKSTWISANTGSRADYAVCSADDYFLDRKTGEYVFDHTKLSLAHAWCCQKVIRLLKAKCPLIFVDNTHTQLWEFETYLQLAELAGYKPRIIEMVLPERGVRKSLKLIFKRQKHGVPENVFLSMWWRWEETQQEVERVNICLE